MIKAIEAFWCLIALGLAGLAGWALRNAVKAALAKRKRGVV